MFVSKYDAEAYSDVKVMSETARAACIRATIAEIWKIFSEWGYHCSTNEDVFQSISYIFLYTRDTETVCLPFLVVHDQLHAHLSKDKGEKTNGEETNWCKRALGLAKANEVLAELKHQKTKLLRAVFVFISPSPTRYWQTVRHAFVCLHTFSTKSRARPKERSDLETALQSCPHFNPWRCCGSAANASELYLQRAHLSSIYLLGDGQAEHYELPKRILLHNSTAVGVARARAEAPCGVHPAPFAKLFHGAISRSHVALCVLSR
jgi:hypothetical protein